MARKQQETENQQRKKTPASFVFYTKKLQPPQTSPNPS
jgi:hypothetical protein